MKRTARGVSPGDEGGKAEYIRTLIYSARLDNRRKSVAAGRRCPFTPELVWLRTICRWKTRNYHGGSVWTHDTAMAVQGLARAAAKGVPGAASASALIDGLLAAAAGFEYRMPELSAGSPARGPGAPDALSGLVPAAGLGGSRFGGGGGGGRGATGCAGGAVRGSRVGTMVLDVRLDSGDVRVLSS